MIPILITFAALVPGDELLVCSFQPAGIQRFDASSGSFEQALGASSPLAGVLGAAIGPDGRLYVASETSNEILRFEAASGAFIDAFVRDDPGTSGDETGGLDGPSGVAFGPDGRLYVGSFESDSVLAYDPLTGAFDGVFVADTPGNLDGPDAGMVFGPGGDLFVPSYWNHRVKRYDGTTGAFLSNFITPAASGLTNPRTVLFPGDGTVLVTSEGTDEVLRFDAATGGFLNALVADDLATGVDETGGLDAPTGMAIGSEGRLWVASLGTDEVKRYDMSLGTYMDTPIAAGAGGVSLPTYLLFRPRVGTTCSGAPNSVGPGATLVVSGSTSVGANDFRLELTYAPPGQPAVFAQSSAGNARTIGVGTLCLGTPALRLSATTIAADGRVALDLDLTAPAFAGAAIVAGSSWHFQVGYMDPAAGLPAFNFSDALRAVFSP